MVLFDVFLPLSYDQFLKGDFFDSFNGLRYRRPLPAVLAGISLKQIIPHHFIKVLWCLVG